MHNYTIKPCQRQDRDFIDDKLIEFNLSQVAPQRAEPFLDLSRKIVDDSGEIVAGILCSLTAWNFLYVDILWVDQDHRGSGLGSKLLSEVEAIAKAEGCYLVHLDTFDFQAKGFYLKQGYEVFGVLDDCPVGHQRFFLKKRL